MSERYLIYLRKSRQDDPNETVEEVLSKHENILQEYALKNFGYRIPEYSIMREICSGETIQDRPKIRELLKKLETDNITGVLVVDVSRLSRGELLDAGTIVQAFKYTNTKIILPTGKTYDLNDKYDKQFFEMELTRSNYYLEVTKELLLRGRIESIKSGNYIGSYAPYGYKKVKIDKTLTLVPDETESPYVKLMFEMYAYDKVGCQTIANKLNSLGAKTRNGRLFNEGTIRQILSNETYIGKVRYGYRKLTKVLEEGKLVKKRNRDYSRQYMIIDGKHQPLISKELWETVQERKGENTREKNSSELQNPLAGLLKCNKCKTAITQTIYRKEKRKTRYNCRNHYNCDNISSNTDIVINALINGLKTHLKDFEIKVDNNTDISDNTELIVSLNKQISDTNKKLNDICDYLESGLYTVEMFISRKDKLNKELERLENALKEANKVIPEIEKDKMIISSLYKAIDMLNDDNISAKLKNDFLKSFIKVIWYEKNGDRNNSTITLDIVLK